MKEETKAFLFNLFALLCGIWFLLTGWIWVYFANMILAYPVAIVGLLLWYRARKIAPGSLFNRVTLAFFILGFTVSIAGLFIYK